MPKSPNLPAGAMFELSAPLIDEGKFLTQLNKALTKTHKGLADYAAETSDLTQKAVITARIEIAYEPDCEGVVTITTRIDTRTPVKAVKTMVREKAGHMLVQPTGSSPDSPDQMRMFDHSGRMIGEVNLSTGELIEPEDTDSAVAGRVGNG